jgi:protein-arginine kinase activator protein McsA
MRSSLQLFIFIHSQIQESFSSLSNQMNYNHHQQQTINKNNLESQICKNCHKKQSLFLQYSFNDKDSSPYVISFVQHSTLHIKNRRQFKFVSSTTYEDNAELITLCQQCSNHLILDDIKVANKLSNL